MPTYRFTAEDVLPVVEHVGGMLEGIPPHLSVAACLMLAYTMVNGEAVPQDKIAQFLEDFTMLMDTWDMEAKN